MKDLPAGLGSGLDSEPRKNRRPPSRQRRKRIGAPPHRGSSPWGRGRPRKGGKSGRAAGFTVSAGLPIPLRRWAASEEAGGGETPRGAHVSGTEGALVAAHSCCFAARHAGGKCAETGSSQETRLNGLGCSSLKSS